MLSHLAYPIPVHDQKSVPHLAYPRPRTWVTLQPGVDKIQVFSTLVILHHSWPTLHRTPDLSYTTPDLLHATPGLPYTTAELPCLTLPYTTPGLP